VKRREFIKLIGGATAAWPFGAHAQQAGRLPTIGWLGNYASTQPAAGWKAAFMERLKDLGWIEGRTDAIEYRWIEDKPDRAAEFAAEFVRQTVDVIVTYGSLVPALKQATSSIPIVFTVATVPVGKGFVSSLNRPGGNVTGMSTQDADTAGKRLAVLRQAVPTLRRLAIVFDAGYPSTVRESDQVRAVARALDLEVVPLEVRQFRMLPPSSLR